MPFQRILVVDDIADVRTLVGRILESNGYQVVVASDAGEAMQTCDQLHGEIDLLLTDIRMPGMTGIELAGSIAAAYPAIRVLFISGQCEESEIPAPVSAPGFGFLRKPFLPAELLEAVQTILTTVRRPPQTAGSGATKRSRRTG